MFKLHDFFYLAELDPLIEKLVAGGAGLVVVAGLSVPSTDVDSAGRLDAGRRFLPSGRGAIFRAVLYEMLKRSRPAGAIVIARDRSTLRVPRQFSRQVKFWSVQPPYSYAGRIAAAARQKPGLLVIDHLQADAMAAALQAARGGLRVVTQTDTVFRGTHLAYHFLDLGVSDEDLMGLSWIVTVLRMAALCPHCKVPSDYDLAHLAALPYRDLVDKDMASGGRQKQAPVFYRSVGCHHCNGTGRHGDVAVFDILEVGRTTPNLFDQPSVISMQAYALRLATLGYLSFGDVLHLDADILRRTYNMLTASEAALSESNTRLQRKVAELEASNRVLERQTEALISVRDVGQALIASTDLPSLARRVCRHARELCDADRAILYLAQSGGAQAQILAASGWDPTLVGQTVEVAQMFGQVEGEARPAPFPHFPPGVPVGTERQDIPRAGLWVPLVAQRERVGAMIIHAMHAREGFSPGAVSLLQTFANQAALAIQRARLFEQLYDKIEQLEAAQAGLAQKERMERELELAREVQQSVLPRVFPLIPGYTFAARNSPARRVGGDFYDVVYLGEDGFGVVIADVSDKGMPAALYMALTRSLILAEARRERSPRDVLCNVNRLLLELGQADMFVTVFYGVVDTRTRQLTFCRAGHDYPLLLRRGTVQLLRGKGAFLGFLDQAELGLSEEQIDLLPGDRLVLYTDGLTDASTTDGVLLGLDRLCKLLQDCAETAPSELCDLAFESVFAYQGNTEQFDDMTMLVVRVGES